MKEMENSLMIHRIIEFMCKSDSSSFDSEQIANATGIDLSLVNILGKRIISNGDAADASSKDNYNNGTIELLKINATQDAFETGKYKVNF